MLKVVIIDDEDHVRDFIKKYIPWGNLRMEVIGESDDGVTALEVCSRLRPDIILTDIRMPGMDGITLLEEIKKDNPDCEVILISGYAEFSHAQKALRFGALDYIIKPIDETELGKLLLKARDKIEKERRAKDYNHQIKLELKKLQDELENNNDDKSSNAGYKTDNALILKALAYIHEHYNRDITLQEVAEKVFMNEKYFSALFKKEVGVRFTEYITGLRLEKAKMLLKIPHLKVTEVADMVGFKDDSYFINVFKKYMGQAPSEYRQKNV